MASVGNLSHVVVLDGPWQTAENHSRPQTCIEEVELDACRVPAQPMPSTYSKSAKLRPREKENKMNIECEVNDDWKS
jgi:hypothetical protein